MAASGMGSSGIRRKVDDLGRVVIPAGIRRALNIREGDAVEVFVEAERVVLAKPRNACLFCGREDEHLPVYRSRRVCRECLASLGTLDEQVRAGAQPPAGAAEAGAAEPGAAEPERIAEPGAAEPGAAEPERIAERAAPPVDRRPIPPRRHAEPSRSGPIDGDALAREPASRPAGGRPRDDGAGRAEPPRHDPASTTAW